MRMIGFLSRWTIESRIIAKYNLRICHFNTCTECGTKNTRLYRSENSDVHIHKCLNCWEIVEKT
jgi:translation initiation factor 2 beta subunit (eIF-2beta)/eIF-5